MEQPKEPLGCIDLLTDDNRVVPLTVETHTIIPPEHLAQNITENLVRPLPRFVYRDGFGAIKNEPLAIVAAGPTLIKTVERVREFKNILVCGSAHDFLVRQGIIPTYALVCDGGKEDKGNLSLPQADTIYLIASQCDPGLFDHLSSHKVEMWHYRGQAAPSLEEERKLLNGEPSISWGSTVTIVSIQIAMMLGHQDLHFFGFDSCYGDHGAKQHCAPIEGKMEYKKIPAYVGPEKRLFISDLGLMTQAEQFFRIVEANYQFFHSTIHGDGLIAEMCRQGEAGLDRYVTLVP